MWRSASAPRPRSTGGVRDRRRLGHRTVGRPPSAGCKPQLTRLRRYGLIIVDEVGYIPFEQDAANLFFQLVASRYEHTSLVLTSNLPFARWGDVFGDQVVAPAERGRGDQALRHQLTLITVSAIIESPSRSGKFGTISR